MLRSKLDRARDALERERQDHESTRGLLREATAQAAGVKRKMDEMGTSKFPPIFFFPRLILRCFHVFHYLVVSVSEKETIVQLVSEHLAEEKMSFLLTL